MKLLLSLLLGILMLSFVSADAVIIGGGGRDIGGIRPTPVQIDVAQDSLTQLENAGITDYTTSEILCGDNICKYDLTIGDRTITRFLAKYEILYDRGFQVNDYTSEQLDEMRNKDVQLYISENYPVAPVVETNWVAKSVGTTISLNPISTDGGLIGGIRNILRSMGVRI